MLPLRSQTKSINHHLKIVGLGFVDQKVKIHREFCHRKLNISKSALTKSIKHGWSINIYDPNQPVSNWILLHATWVINCHIHKNFVTTNFKVFYVWKMSETVYSYNV